MARAAARMRRMVGARLSPGAKQRLRFAKWAVGGKPASVTISAKPRGGRSKSKDKKRPARPAPTPPAQPTDGSGPRPLPAGITLLEFRRSCAFATASPAGEFLEIGPAHRGSLAKREGFHTKNADYLTREGLVEKYAEHDGVDTSEIEEVDFVLKPGAPLTASIDGHYDLILAAHVVEHTTSIIGFLNECAALLKPGGTLALVVPDQRYSFDRFRERTALGAVIDAMDDNRRAHSPGTVIEATLNAAKRGGVIAWNPRHRGRYEWVHTLDEVLEVAAQARADADTYIDVHRWTFTPHHFRLLLHDLAATRMITLREAFFHNTLNHEFFVNLTAESDGPSLSRADLVALADGERRSLDVPSFA